MWAAHPALEPLMAPCAFEVGVVAFCVNVDVKRYVERFSTHPIWNSSVW